MVDGNVNEHLAHDSLIDVALASKEVSKGNGEKQFRSMPSYLPHDQVHAVIHQRSRVIQYDIMISVNAFDDKWRQRIYSIPQVHSRLELQVVKYSVTVYVTIDKHCVSSVFLKMETMLPNRRQ